MKKIRVGIIGAGGYGGCGAVELLINHPGAEITALMDKQDIGRPFSQIYPHLKGFCDMPIVDPQDPDCRGDFDIVLYATPDGVGQHAAKKWLEKGIKMIDYSGDFRFSDPESYSSYAERIGKKGEHASPELLPKTVYGLPELHREEIADSNLVGNPGCFATSCILGLAPALKSDLVEIGTIICDGKTGVSGGGKKPTQGFHYPARYDSTNAYKVSGHQHVYEIERELTLVSGKEIRITFTPHVIPMTRGIVTTIYGQLRNDYDLKTIIDAYESMYQGAAFIRVFGPETVLYSSDVRESNFCNLSINLDKRTGKLIVISLIDNLMKGQAGNALQNMNIMFGLEETVGLLRPGRYP